jgi:hypothetical protein
LTLLEILTSLEDNVDMHLGRILILLRAFSGKKGTYEINGLTKLVKLDFLLRYPVYLEKALEKKKAPPETAKVLDYERKSIESSMIRYHYGPWDPRYRFFINLLIGKGLVRISLTERTINIGLTELGFEKANELSENINFADTTWRARLLKMHFDIGGTNLKNFIYQTFPEIVSLDLGEEIKYEF